MRVCEMSVCEMSVCEMRWRRRKEEAAGAELKTKTPHKDVGNYPKYSMYRTGIYIWVIYGYPLVI